MMVPKWDPEYAVAEITRVGGEDGVVAAYSWFDPKVPWGAEQFDLVFEALVDNDLSLLYCRTKVLIRLLAPSEASD
jgi:hypothetical protein